MGLQYVHRRRAHGFFPLPLPPPPPQRLFASSPRSHHDLSLFLPSTPFFLFALKTSERTHGASCTYFSVHTIIVERAHRWYWACSSAPRKGPYFSTRLSSPSSSLSSSLPPLPTSSSPSSRRPSRPPTSATFFRSMELTFFFSSPERRNDFDFRQEISSSLLTLSRHSPLFRIYSCIRSSTLFFFSIDF